MLATITATITATVRKETKDTKVGISIAEFPDECLLKVTKISESSLFANTILKVGHAVLSINNISCENKTAKEAVQIILVAEGEVTIVARDPPPKRTPLPPIPVVLY
jgi:C-terminal processing protease CtpA/Prc